MSISRKFQRSKSKYTLSQKIISAVTAAGFIMQPIVGFAQSINKVNNNGSIEVNGNVTNIWADKVVSNSAVNVFKDFQLDANNIANMYFNTKGASGADAANLVNFVNSRIDINGTVNAVQNSQIGGNLFFLSKEGMAVGKSGVINTGSLYVMTPVERIYDITSPEHNYSYEALKGTFDSGSEANINTALNRMQALNIPLNAEGTISVLGKVNATGDVKMAAAKIGIGKNVSGVDLSDGTKASEIVNTAVIKTAAGNEFNFADLVNIKDANGNVVTNAGLGSDLTAVESGNGDIVLAAKAEYANTLDQTFNDIGEIIGLDVDVPKTIEASVESYGTITARGNAELTAEATNGNKDLAEEVLKQTTDLGTKIPDYVPVPAADAGNYAQTVAKVEVQGDITAGQDIKVAANADNTYVDNEGIEYNVSNILQYITPVNANVMILGSKAEVNIGEKADLTADGVIDVTANSVLDGTAGAAVNGRKLVTVSTVSQAGSFLPSAAVGYADVENSAKVDIQGNLTAKGANKTDDEKAVNIAAYAEESVANTANLNISSTTSKPNNSLIAAAVAVTESSNTADVIIGSGSSVNAANGDVDITADTVNLLNANAASIAPDNTVGAAAVNVFSHDGHANIAIDGDITGQNVAIDATNLIDENTITANNELGMGKIQAQLVNAIDPDGLKNAVKNNQIVKDITTNIKNALGSSSSGDESKTDITQVLSDKFEAGAAVVVTNENNSANVTFGKTADVTAKSGDITADADVRVVDYSFTASGTSNSYKKSAADGSTTTVTVGAGVVYAGMDNEASVVFADGDGSGEEQHAELSAAGNINVTSSNIMEYNRPQRIFREIQRSIENIEYAIDAFDKLKENQKQGMEEYRAGLESLKKSLQSYIENYSNDFTEAVKNPDAITAEGTMNKIFEMAAAAAVLYNNVVTLQTEYNTVQSSNEFSAASAIISNSLAVVTNALAFADPNNYANVAAQASAKGGSESSKFAASGSVAVSDFSGTSGVKVGKYTKLEAGKDLNLESANEIEDVTITGKTMFWKNNAEAKGGVGIGGSFNYQNFDTDSSVVVEEGAELTAGDIAIASDSNVFHVGAMLGAGKSDGSALSGMVSLTDSDSYNNVIVDTDAKLTATKDSAGNTGIISIDANNDTSVTNAIVTFSASGANAGVGMGVAINNIDVQNTAQIIDNDGNEDKNDGLEGKISASELNVNAETTGLINSVSVAGGMTSSGTDSEEGFLDKVKAPYNKMTEISDSALGGINNISKKLQNVISTMNLNASGGSTVTGAEEAGTPGFSFAGAGSVSLNMVSDTTKAVVDGANITLNNGALQVGARDSAFTGAWSGAAGLSFRKEQQSQKSTSVAVSGAVGVNDIDNEITALVKDSTVTGAKDVDVAAVSGGTTVAAGLGATLTKDGAQGKNYSGGGSVSVNLLDKDVNANMKGVKLTGDESSKADIDVAAYESDVQVTGGVNANIALGGGSLVGGGVTVADIKNNINAGITGGKYTNVDDVNVKGLLAVTQVTAAVSAGVAAGGSGTNNAFGGAVVYNGLSNDITAGIDGAAIAADGLVNVMAKDTDEANPYQDLLGDYSEHNNFAAERGIDTTGSSYYTDLNTNGESVNYSDNEGSTIVGAAAVVAAGSNSNAGGAAVNIANIDNDFTAKINNANITAENVRAEADADTLIVNASGGVAAGTKSFGGMGSVTWQDIDNDLSAEIENSTITTNRAEAKAINNTQAVNVAGSVSYGKNAGIGATLAYNGLDNTVGAYMRGNTIKALGTDVDVFVDTDNTGKVYGIAAGVAASTKVAINGSVAVNRGGSNTEAIIDKSKDDKNEEKESKIIDAGSVKVTADDKTYRLAVVGQVSASGKAAIGGGVAYNDIGGSSAGSESSSQNTTAAVRNTDITIAADGEKTVNVAAKDTSKLNTISAGVAAAATAGVQGSAATALVNKNVTAEIENTDIYNNNASKNANVTVDAQNNSKITTSADTASVAGQGAGVGAGVAVNRIIQQTNAAVNGGTMNVNNLTVNANGTPSIENIGIGIAVAGQGAGVSGSVAVNMIDNDVTAHISDGANIVAYDNVGVIATSDEQIANYAGQASVAGIGGSVGLSVSVNEIVGDTKATVDGDTTSISASGNGEELAVKDTVNDSAILDNFVDEEVFKAQDTLGNDRIENEYNGVVVSASSTHAIKSFLVNGGVAGEGAAVTGTVNVNMIDGSTKAAVNGADINKNIANAADVADVNVIAHDYTNSAGLVGSASVAGIGGGVGLGSDTNTVSREVTAEVVGRTDSDGNADSVINAGAFNVEADAQQGISSLTVGLGAAGIGAGVSNATSVTLLDGKTTAKVADVNITADSVDVLAKHGSRLNTLGVVVGAGGVGAGVGIGVSVLNENSETAAETTNSNISINDCGQENGDVNIKADNDTKVNYQLYSAGGGLAGVAGAIGVSNVNSKVNTTVAGTAIGSETKDQANDINIGAENNINFINNSGSAAGGGVGVGVGVAVNTIDSQVNTSIDYSELNAVKDINITAKENRTVNQMAVNAGVGAVSGGANVMITNIGSAIESTYGSGLQTDDDGNVVEDSSVNVDSILKEANDAVEGNKLQDGYTMGVDIGGDVDVDGDGDVDVVPKVEAGKGTDGASKIEVDIDNTAINAGNKVTAEAVADTNVSMDAVQAGGGVFANVSGTVGILDVNRNSIINISNTIINSKDLAVNTSQKGNSGLDIYQGGFGGTASIGAAYGSATSNGVNNISVAGSDFDVTGNIDINANDESRTEVNAIGVSLAGGGAASVIVAQGENNSETTIDVSGTDINAAGDINIHAERQAKDENGDIVDNEGNKYNSLSVSAIAASGGLMFAGAGVGATANEYGTVGVEVNGSDFTAGNDISITALNAPSVKAVTGAVAGSMVASGAITVAEANIGGAGEDEHLETYVRLNDESSDESVEESGKESSEAENRKNSFTADSLTAEATVDAQQTADMNGISVSAALWPTGSVQVNVGGADIYSDVEVSVGENLFKGNSDTDGIDLTISGSNSVAQNVSAKGIAVSTFVASGTNAAESNAELNTDVTVAGSSQDSKVHDLTVRANSNADITAAADGTGGGLVGVSPNAASVDNDYIANTSVNIGGNWNTAGAVEATAINGGDINVLSDALQAVVVGGSGVWLDNNIDNQADVNITDAEINSEGRQSYTAQNIADYDGDIKGSGYGGVTITGTQLEDTFNYSANVNIENSELHATGDEGSITAQALTEGNISSYNILKSAGVIPVSVADSRHTTTYNNAVNINGSRLITDKKNQDITLAASDNTRVDLNTTADTQGGFAGAATADAVNNFNRYNAVNIDSSDNTYIESANDVNLYAGVDANGKYSSLNLDIIADAYNRTLLPLSTNPTVDNNMSQNNTVTIDGDVASVRHINAKAVKGNTTIGKSATVYKNIGGGGKGSVTTTIGGNDEGTDEVYNNGITADGNLTAGIHNKLDISITGTTETNIVYKDKDKGIVDKEKSGVSYEKVDVDVEQEWFDESKIVPAEVTIVNNLKEEYNQLASIIGQYPEGTSEHTNIEEAMNALQSQMDALGFVIKDNKGNAFGEPLSEKTVLGIELPDIVVSGGNINFETDSLSGDGSITAKGAPQVNIDINSDLYLKVNDITIQDNGGIVRLNGSQANGTLEGFTGTVSTPGTGATTETPAINITSKSASSYTSNTLAQPDIAIFGDIVNAVGDINISSTNNDITINENAQLSARNITLSAANGSVTQNSTEGIYNVAGDPVSQYQFSVDVATKIQEYVDGQLRDKPNWSISFNTREEYINWLKETVGVTDEELGNTQISESAGIVAGNNVYINALDANINGLVQAGYGDYLAELGDDEITNINNLINTYKGKNFTDSEVLGNSDFLITKGDKVWDSTDKVWDYEIAVYYNPTTKKLLVDNVNPNGGQIYINGAVSSTGNGRLMAMDGTANIDIDTTAIADNVSGVVINNITNNDIQGLISITDTNTNKVTEIRNGEWRQYEVGTAVQDRPEWNSQEYNDIYDGKYYNPEEGLSYQYTGGYKSGEINYKSYTKDFLFWTGLKYDQSTTIEEAIKAEGGEADIHVQTETTDGSANGRGTFISKNDKQNGIWSISGSYVRGEEKNPTNVHPGEPQYGPPKWLGYIGGYGTIEYTWTTENATTSSTTSSIKADIPIQIGFLGNGNKSGDINVNSNQNIELAGNISNAEVGGAGKGSVTLNSNNGSVSAIGSANINSDDVNIKAATGVNVNHAAIGDTANINVATDNGDISFVSSAGDLKIEQMITGITYKDDGTIDTDNIDASTGSVYLEAQGDILDAAKGDYAVKGQRIDLVSHTGNIGALDDKGNIVNALRVLGGSELYSSDAMASSVNAQANGDIVLTQTNGNMRLGTIVSEIGDAVLTVDNGSFVDAHPSENNDNSSAQDKIDRWLEAGLIVDEAADQNAKAAQQAKEERLAGLEMQMNSLAYENGEVNADKVKSYKDAANKFNTAIKDAKAEYQAALSAEGADATTIKAAFEKYQAAQQEFFNSKNFSEAEQSVITNYAEVSSSENYGWSKNQLLYAIQNSVINSNPGEVQTVETPNVTANNITLNAANGGIGIDGAAQFISNDGLNNEKNLKILAAAKAGDLTWGKNVDGVDGVTIRQQQAITVQVKQEGGKVDVTGKDNVYLAGVQGTELNVNGITTTGDIRLQGDEGVIVDGTLTGVDLTITGGTGDIMGAGSDVYVDTNISGTLDANADGSIYISQNGDLKVLAVATNALADLKATNNILMSDVEGSQAKGYINAQTLNLTAGGSIGTDAINTNALRILNNGVVVNAKANKENGDIILAGVTGTGLDGELVLGAIEGANLDVTSAGNVSIGKDASEDEAAVEGSIDVNGDASISAEHGSVTQTADSNIKANAVKASATENILLNSKKNKVNSFVVNGLGADNSLNGSVELAGSKDSGFTADLNGITVNNGGVTVTNYAENGTLNISGGSVKTTDAEKGSVTFSSEGSITSDATVNSAANINMNADGAIDNDGSLTAHNNVNVDTTAGAIELGGSVTANTGTVTVHSDKGAIHIGNDNGNGTVNAGTDVSITTNEGNITTTGAVSGGSNVKVDAGTKGNIELGGIVNAEGGNVDVDTQSGDVTTEGEVTGKIDVTINSDDGDVTIGGKVQSETGSTHINAGTEEEPGITEDKDGNVTVNGEVASGKEVIVNANNGSIIVTGNTTASDGNVQTTVKGDGNINLNGSVSASGDVQAEVTGEGDISTGSGASVSGTDITFTTNDGSITTGSNLTANANVNLNTNTGDIILGGDTTAKNGNITININKEGSLKDAANTDNTLSAFSPDNDASKGNIYINLKGIGDVDLSEIYADNDARVDVADGNLTLGTINGQLVAIQLRTQDREMNVGEIIAGTQIVLTGSDMSLDQISQRPDADGMLVITPDNAEEDKPIDNFTIGDIKTNADSGIRFDRLWVNNSDIHISEGQLWFDKLYVEDNAHFSNDEMSAAIYGKPPLRDGSDSVYWINTEENRPESSLDMWLNGTGDWMYLRFTDDHIQESNGILLTLDEYDYVYDQRFTAENHLRWQHGRYLDEDWKQAYGYGLSLHNRYGLIDYQEFTETNAGADEVAVEA